MLVKPSSNLQRTGGDHRGGHAQPGWRTFMMTCLHWILGYMRLEIWCKIGLSADWCLCTALLTRSGARYCWIGYLYLNYTTNAKCTHPHTHTHTEIITLYTLRQFFLFSCSILFHNILITSGKCSYVKVYWDISCIMAPCGPHASSLVASRTRASTSE